MGIDVVRVTQGAEDPQQAQALLRELGRDEWLEPGQSGNDQSDSVRPTPKTVRMFEGWPSGAAEDAFDDLVSDLNTAIEQTPDDEKRSKLIVLRNGLLTAGRDVALAYFEKKVMGLS